jgi:hypothetical protein
MTAMYQSHSSRRCCSPPREHEDGPDRHGTYRDAADRRTCRRRSRAPGAKPCPTAFATAPPPRLSRPSSNSILTSSQTSSRRVALDAIVAKRSGEFSIGTFGGNSIGIDTGCRDERRSEQNAAGQRPVERCCTAAYGAERDAEGHQQGIVARQVHAGRLGRSLSRQVARPILKCDCPAIVRVSETWNGTGVRRPGEWPTEFVRLRTC